MKVYEKNKLEGVESFVIAGFGREIERGKGECVECRRMCGA